MSLEISAGVSIPDDEISLGAVRAQGAGGQNVNKVATAIHLRFDFAASSLPQVYKDGLSKLRDRRISESGVITIKAQRFRSQEKNRQDALARLADLVRRAAQKPRPRRATQPTKASRQRRLDAKTHRGQVKGLRGKVDF